MNTNLLFDLPIQSGDNYKEAKAQFERIKDNKTFQPVFLLYNQKEKRYLCSYVFKKETIERHYPNFKFVE